MAHTTQLILEFVRRELRLRYLGTFTGAAWALLQPLFQLLIYSYVFSTIFQARLPSNEFGELRFVTFLAIGLWPWMVFSDGLSRASTSIIDNAGLLGKVSVPRPVLVVAPLVATTILHATGFGVVLLVLSLGGWAVLDWKALLLPILFVALFVFTLGMAMLFAALSVFVRDLTHALAQILMLLFFLTPVLYPSSLVPESLRGFAEANPLALFVGLFRHAALGVGGYQMIHYVVAAVAAAASLFLGWFVFRRLAPHFEDFL